MTDTPSVSRIPVPSIPDVRVHKKIPKPFARPAISIGAPALERREWTITPVTDLKAGDIVPGIGRVFEVTEKLDIAARSWTVTVKGGADNVRTYGGNETVWAFTVDASAHR